MRQAFFQTLFSLARKNARIMLVTGDLGYSLFEPFEKALPSQFLNAGIAEQNMTGIAAGLALEGYIPVIYSITPFAVMRNFEQVRNDICSQHLNVKIIGVGTGFSYGAYGKTHYGLEDVALLRSLPGMVILGPGDPVETRWAVAAALGHKGPVYIRLGKAGEPVIHTGNPRFSIGKGVILHEGTDVTLIATSTLLPMAREARETLAREGISARLVSMHTVKPIDTRLLLDSAKKTRAIVSIEEHSIVGGLGSAVAEVIAEQGIAVPFGRVGVADTPIKTLGRQEFMRRRYGLSVARIVRVVEKLIHVQQRKEVSP